jgi:hypothetical protein
LSEERFSRTTIFTHGPPHDAGGSRYHSASAHASGAVNDRAQRAHPRKVGMDFSRESILEHPADTVLELMIHRMEELVPFLTTVESIETLAHEARDDGRIRIRRRWQGLPDTAPKALRPFLNRELIAWYDEALWTPSEYKVEWQLSSSMGRFYSCGGMNFFEPNPAAPDSSTRVRLTGDLEILADQIPGVPKFLARRAAPQIEKFIVSLVTPNLNEVVTGLQGYLGQKG